MKKILVVGNGKFTKGWVFYTHKNYQNIIVGRKKSFSLEGKFILAKSLNFKCLIKTALDVNPDVIINAVALTNLELCENSPSQAFESNALIALDLAIISSILDIPLVQISTDNFSSDKNLIRNEDIKTIPVNIYGASKILGEKYVKMYASKYIIVRTNFFSSFGSMKNSFLNNLISNFRESRPYYGATDYKFNPVSLKFLVNCIKKLLDNSFQGIINVSADECVSKYEFSLLVNQKLGFSNDLVKPTTLSHLNIIPIRPKNMCLDNKKLKSLLNISRLSLHTMLEEELKNQT